MSEMKELNCAINYRKPDCNKSINRTCNNSVNNKLINQSDLYLSTNNLKLTTDKNYSNEDIITP